MTEKKYLCCEINGISDYYEKTIVPMDQTANAHCPNVPTGIQAVADCISNALGSIYDSGEDFEEQKITLTWKKYSEKELQEIDWEI
jgi:hypothetical protein